MLGTKYVSAKFKIVNDPNIENSVKKGRYLMIVVMAKNYRSR